MKYLRLFLLGSLVSILTACSHSGPDKSQFVKYAQTFPPIVVPAGIPDPTGENYYAVPPVQHTFPLGVKPPLAPPGSQLTVYKNKPLPMP